MFEVNSKRLLELLLARRLTVAGLARLAGISYPTASKILNNGAKVRADIIGKLAEVFGVEFNALIKE